MANVTNTCKQPLGLPSGIVVAPGATVLVPSWESDSQNKVVKSWLRGGVLRVDAAAKPAAPVVPEPAVEEAPQLDDRDEKDLLIDALAEYGINKDRRSSVASLQAALAEAQAGE